MFLRRDWRPWLLSLLVLPSVLQAQTTTTPPIPIGATHSTENSLAVSGVRIRPMPDGTVWFLIPANDRIVQLQADGVTFKQWQIRPDNELGANPVDFQIDGNLIWFIENGESQIDPGYSALGRLDTDTGDLTEWVIPGSRPANFWRAPDGNTVWIPQSNSRLEELDLTTLQVLDYHSSSADGTVYDFAFSDGIPGPDGALWLTDFGNNRIVRYVPGATSETSWTIFDPTVAQLNPSQIGFDAQGDLWITEFAAARVDRFDPSTSTLVSYGGFSAPIHFDMFNGRLYITEATGGDGIVDVLDPNYAIGTVTTLTPQTLQTSSIVNQLATTIRDTTITPTTFTSTLTNFPTGNITATAGVGLESYDFPDTDAYGISVADGGVWVGTDGFLVRMTLNTIGLDSDRTVPIADEFGFTPGERVKIDLTLANPGTSAITGNAYFLASPAIDTPTYIFTVNPGATVVVPDAFETFSSEGGLVSGPIRLEVTSGTASDLLASARTERALDDGSSFGFSFPAQTLSQLLLAGATETLFTDARSTTDSILGFFAPQASVANLQLVAPDGTVRATQTLTLDTNVWQEFNPAASAFGVSPEPGDVVRAAGVSGDLQMYVLSYDNGTSDLEPSPPIAATQDAILPNIGAVAGGAGTQFVSDLYVSNPDPANTAHVELTYAPLGQLLRPPLAATLTLPPNTTQITIDVLPTLFGVTAGQGTIGVHSDVAVAVSARVAARVEAGDFGTFVPAIDERQPIAGGTTAWAIGVAQTSTRHTNLLLYNNGAVGTVTINAVDTTGSQVGQLTVTMQTYESARVDSVLEQMGLSDQDSVSLQVQPSAGMLLYAETAQVDSSGDVDIATLLPSP